MLMRFGLVSVRVISTPPANPLQVPVSVCTGLLKPEGLSVTVGDINFAAYLVTVFPASCTLYSLFASAGFTFVFVVENRKWLS